MMTLISGTDSTWSLRAWLCARIAGLNPEVIRIDLTTPDFKQEILKYSSAGLVPVLIQDDLVIHDSLAIAEYLNEISGGKLYPDDTRERALARSLCAEMHSGFSNVRAQCSFTQQEVPPLNEWDENIQVELSRISTIFAAARLPFMFEQLSAVDAFYAVLAKRLSHYGIELKGKAGDYQQSLNDWPLLAEAFTTSVI